ncbi:hypothetical protein OROMI_027759 [Orobanche minor]
MFAVMKNLKYNTIPDIYLKSRCTQKACSVFEGVGQNGYASNYMEGASDPEGVFALACKCIGMVAGDEENTSELVSLLSNFAAKYSTIVQPLSTADGKANAIQQYYGAPIPDTAEIGTPNVSKNKGSCSRTKSKREAAIERAKKPERQCKKCMKWGHHDSRNCDKVNGKVD